MTLEFLTAEYAVCRLTGDAAVPDWFGGDEFAGMTRTRTELSLIVPADRVPSGVEAETGWSGFRVLGALAFSEVGILSGLTSVLAEAAIPLLSISTFDTDYIFVPSDRAEAATSALQLAGFGFSGREDQHS